jgi:hypothetical protein
MGRGVRGGEDGMRSWVKRDREVRKGGVEYERGAGGTNRI